MKKAIISTFMFLSSVQSAADSPIEVPEIANIFSCTTMKSWFSHNISKVDDEYKGFVMFPPYMVDQTPEEIEAKKKEWAEWEPGAPQPTDDRKTGIMLPLENTNMMVTDVGRLQERKESLKNLFPDIITDNFTSIDFMSVRLDFGADGCSVSEADGILSVFCETKESQKLFGGETVDRISLGMTNQVVKQIGFNANGQAIVVHENIVQTVLTFHYNGQAIRSAFTYKPKEGSDSQCTLGEEKLPQFN